MTAVVAPEVRNSGAGADATGARVTRWLLAGVASAAGVIGVAMLTWPGSTGRYFSWELRPAAVATLVGACYVASAIVFGWAATSRSWAAQRGLCVAVLGLAGPTLVITAVHADVFDFSRWQAVAWVVLFSASVTSFASLVRVRRSETAMRGPRLPPWTRAVLTVIAVTYAGVAVLLWLAPRAVSDHGPVISGPMGLRFIGSWAAFLALCAAISARSVTRDATRLPIAALVLFPAACLAAVLSSFDDLRTGPANALAAGLALLTMAGLSVSWTGRRVGLPTTRGGAVR